MKIYISAEIEGVNGVVSNDQCHKGGHLYSYGRKQMTLEINAAIEGAIEAGATEIVVNDAHGTSLNIIPDLLHEDAELILGSVKPNNQMAGIDSSFDAAMLIGYHARSNSKGVLCHSIVGYVNNMWINDNIFGETAYNSAIAGTYDVPVILVTGDDIVCAEAKKALDPSVTTVSVKKAISGSSAESIHPKKALTKIKEGAKKAVKNIPNCNPFKLQPPYTAKMQFVVSVKAQTALRYPNTEMIDNDTVIYKTNDMLDALNALFGMMKCGS